MATAVESLTGFRAVVVQGARQVGKSTIAELIAAKIGASEVSLDREEDLSSAIDDPLLFLQSLGVPAVIDEIQRGGEPLVLAIKQRLDKSRNPGQYLLTGSTNFLTTPAVSESLAGRIDLVTLWPLSMGEMRNGADDFVDRAFSNPTELLGHRGETPTRDEYVRLVCAGGYPEVQRLAMQTSIRSETPNSDGHCRASGQRYPSSNATSGAGTANVLWSRSRTVFVARIPQLCLASMVNASRRHPLSTHFDSTGTVC